MFRYLPSLILITAVIFIAAPFLLSSLAVDERGVPISGRVIAKTETVTVSQSIWDRTAAVTVQYQPPDFALKREMRTEMSTDRYDRLHIGDTVPLHYLLQRDVPRVPLAEPLRQLNVLPEARISDRRTFSAIQDFFLHRVGWLEVLAVSVIFLVMLRASGSPLFKWILGVEIAAVFGLMLYSSFPRPTPNPKNNVLRAGGTVKSVQHIRYLFSGRRSRGFAAAQPVDVVGVEFVPSGRSDAVLAVDLIDTNSVAELAVNAPVWLEYEAASPRTAHLLMARRDFAESNLNGIAMDSALLLAGLAVLLAIATWIDRTLSRLGRKLRERTAAVRGPAPVKRWPPDR
jgi:hypothetical protein